MRLPRRRNKSRPRSAQAAERPRVKLRSINWRRVEITCRRVGHTSHLPVAASVHSIHSNNARKAGATEAKIVEDAMVAASLRPGAAVTHAAHALAC